MIKQKVIFIGAGGFAKSALDSLDKEKYELCGFIDSFKPVGTFHLGFPILSSSIKDWEQKYDYQYFISIGDNKNRSIKYSELLSLECKIMSIIDPTALVAKNVLLGEGLFVGKMAIINSGTSIGNNVVINTKALLEHGYTIGDHINISTNTTLNGDVVIRSYAFVGSSAVINGQLSVGEHSVVGSGSVVIRSVEPYTVVAGVPAKFIKSSMSITM